MKQTRLCESESGEKLTFCLLLRCVAR